MYLHSYLLVASAASVVGSILVEMFQFPVTTTIQIGHMCLVTACAAGNWGMEAAEVRVTYICVQLCICMDLCVGLHRRDHTWCSRLNSAGLGACMVSYPAGLCG